MKNIKKLICTLYMVLFIQLINAVHLEFEKNEKLKPSQHKPFDTFEEEKVRHEKFAQEEYTRTKVNEKAHEQEQLRSRQTNLAVRDRDISQELADMQEAPKSDLEKSLHNAFDPVLDQAHSSLTFKKQMYIKFNELKRLWYEKVVQDPAKVERMSKGLIGLYEVLDDSVIALKKLNVLYEKYVKDAQARLASHVNVLETLAQKGEGIAIKGTFEDELKETVELIFRAEKEIRLPSRAFKELVQKVNKYLEQLGVADPAQFTKALYGQQVSFQDEPAVFEFEQEVDDGNDDAFSNELKKIVPVKSKRSFMAKEPQALAGTFNAQALQEIAINRYKKPIESTIDLMHKELKLISSELDNVSKGPERSEAKFLELQLRFEKVQDYAQKLKELAQKAQQDGKLKDFLLGKKEELNLDFFFKKVQEEAGYITTKLQNLSKGYGQSSLTPDILEDMRDTADAYTHAIKLKLDTVKNILATDFQGLDALLKQGD